jgi:hypothetical protein
MKWYTLTLSILILLKTATSPYEKGWIHYNFIKKDQVSL